MSAYPSDYPANIARGILEHCPTIFRTFMVEYRLTSSHPYPNNGAFPSALIDSLSGYIHLITLGYNPKDIVLVGDSAGGNIALGLVRYLIESAVESCGKLPPSPGALILLSPWADIGPSHRSQGTHVSNRNTDYILATDESHAYIKAGLCSSLGSDIVNKSKYFSPASRYINAINFEGFPRTFLSAGGAEMLLDQLETLKRRMEMDIGTSKESGLQYHFKPDAVHDWLLFPWHEPERTETLKAIGAWMS
jgi:acetyl esterase/lipase